MRGDLKYENDMRATNEELNACAARVRAKVGGGVTVHEKVESCFWEHRQEPEIETTYQIIALRPGVNTGECGSLAEAEAMAIENTTAAKLEERAKRLESEAAELRAQIRDAA